MHPQPQLIARVVALVASVGLLLAIFGCVILLTRLADRSLAQVPVVDAGAQTLTEASTRAHFSAVSHPTGTWTAPGRDSLAVAHHNHRRRLDRFRAPEAATTAPVGLDRSFDLRADLRDMATSIRWHRSPASDLPPGSD